ncbi:hypothetical protein [Streptomyces sp. NBC_00878]|uniref:hypothetical protein n=1 Tax=Streptomyces sp. NBC_00878 TaxID=2975854 RepID=UPI002258875B|nr:hypothetical protein [Streptomyces sp. NBC_00878]MCX4909263.1 hypothetical protein [Streptomyces sp. NBC_00878]
MSEALERPGLVPVAHSAHAASSAVALCGILVCMVAFTLTARRYAPLARFGPALVALELAVSLGHTTTPGVLLASRDVRP